MLHYIPQRGHFIWIDFNPQSGHEQKGTRPALVISHTTFNETRKFAFVCPISNTKRLNPFYITIPEREMVTGVIMVEQMRSLDYVTRRAQLTECQLEVQALSSELQLCTAILNTVNAIAVVLDRSGKIIRCNRAWEQTASYGFDEVRNQSFWDLFLRQDEKESVKLAERINALQLSGGGNLASPSPSEECDAERR